MNRKAKVGLIGLGRMGSNHLKTILKIKDIEILFIVEPRFQQLDEISNFLNVHLDSGIKFYNTSKLDFIDEIDKVDYCVVATPIDTHKDIAIQLARKNIPSIVEKPLSFNSQDSRETIDIFIKNNIPLLVGYTERFNLGVRTLKELLFKEKIIGDTIHSIATYRENPYPINGVETGVIFDLATHDIDIVHYLFQSQYKNILGKAFKLNKTRQYEDALYILGELNNNIVVTHSINRIALEKKRLIEVVGNKGKAILDLITQRVLYCSIDNLKNGFIFSKKDLTPYKIKDYQEPLILEHKEFIKSIKENKILIDYDNVIANQTLLDTLKNQLTK